MEIVLKLIATVLFLLGLASSATADQRFEFSAVELPAEGRIVIPVTEGQALTGIAARSEPGLFIKDWGHRTKR